MSIYDTLQAHLESQPFQVIDEEGNEVNFSANVDEDGDISIKVDLSDLHRQIADSLTEIVHLEEEISDLEDRLDEAEL
jgi:hypothetical protein